MVVAELNEMETKVTRPNMMTIATAAVISFAGVAFAASPAEETAQLAHGRYLDAINANDPVALLATVTDDIVFIAPNSPAMVGKAEVEPWVRGYFDAMETSWEKTSKEFVVAGDWAFERYTYKSVNMPHGSDDVYVETGNGINIYHLGADEVWCVARDVWATDGMSVTVAPEAELLTCASTIAPC